MAGPREVHNNVRMWIGFAFAAFLVWGFCGFFPKLAADRVSSQSALVYHVLGAVVVGAIVIIALPFRLEGDVVGSALAVLTGAAATLGSLFLFLALRTGAKASVVVPTTALYPLATVALSVVFLKERVSVPQGIGMLTAFVAMVLMSME